MDNNVFKDVRFHSKEQLEALKAMYKDKYGKQLRVVIRDDFKNWDRFLRGCLDTFILLHVIAVIGLLALYASILAGYVERLPTLEDLILNRISAAIQALYPADQNAFFNIQAGCSVDGVGSCQVQLLNPFRVIEEG